MKITKQRQARFIKFFTYLGEIFPYHISWVIASCALVIILLIGILPSKGLIARDQAGSNLPPDKSLIKPDVLGVQNKESSISGEVGSKEAEPEILGPKVPILMYHYIRPLPDCNLDRLGCSLSVPPPLFEQQMDYLTKNGWTTITLDDLVASFKDLTILPTKPLILTFDDGYEDFYTSAWPILQKYNLKSTIYVLAEGERLNLTQHYDHYMSNSQIRQLANSPLITVAAHTIDHSYLKGRSGYLQQDQIFRSKSEIEAITGFPVRHFAYPYGAYDGLTIKLVQDAGFVTAASTIAGSRNNLSTIDTLRRVRIADVGPNPLQWFVAQLVK